jgi:hypothetical protein
MKIKPSAVFFTVNDTIFRAILGGDGNAFASEIQIFVANTLVRAVGDEHRVSFLGCVDSCLDCQLIRWNMNSGGKYGVGIQEKDNC